MTGKKLRPATEPVFSGGSRQDFPLNDQFDCHTYEDFITGLIKNTQKVLISQSLFNGHFSGCFATSTLYSPRPAQTWALRSDYESLVQLARETWNKGQMIYSFACDENRGFGLFFMEKFGTDQCILRGTSGIEEKWNEGFKITACAARESTIYVIMTKNTREYKGKSQKWFTGNTWNDVKEEIKMEYNKGKAISGICYSSGLKQYFVVMTATTKGQNYMWFQDSCEASACGNWVHKRYLEGYHPTIIFNDPSDNKILVVMTTDDSRSDYTCSYKLS